MLIDVKVTIDLADRLVSLFQSATQCRTELAAPAAVPAPIPFPAQGAKPEPPKEEPATAVSPAVVEPPVAPVTSEAPAYTLEQIAKAGAALRDAGRLNDLKALLNAFGVSAITYVPKERYAEFAASLRSMGANI